MIQNVLYKFYQREAQNRNEKKEKKRQKLQPAIQSFKY